MKIKEMTKPCVALAVAFCAVSPVSVSAQEENPDHVFDVSSQLDIFNSAYRMLDAYYVDSLDAKKVVTTGIKAMFRSLDPYTEYFPKEEEEDLKMLTQAKYGGIGSIIRQMKDSTVIILEPYEGMPAAEVGLQAGDVLLRIDDNDLKGKTSSDVSTMLRGEPGTTFSLKFQRPGEVKPRTVKITRQNIKMPCITYSGMLQVDGIGYINLNSFTNDCFPYVRKAVIALKEQGARALVLDLRGNGGGALDQAVSIVNLFVEKGQTIVETKGKVSATHQVYETNDEPLDLNMPLVVLVNDNSASASEIVAGSLQDLDRAVIIGTRTYGKGLVQAIRGLPYDANMKLTTAKYYIPSGRCIQEIDYNLRRNSSSDGKAKPTAAQDSIFYTKNHREVMSGRGIAPDITVKHDTLQNILIYLAEDDILIKWATRYCQTHQRPATIDEFEITDADYADFKQAVIDGGFKFDRLSDSNLKQLKKVAQFEGYYDDAKAEFDALEAKLQGNLEADLDRNQKDIRSIIALEIAKRWYFEAGAVKYSLRNDPDLDQAIEILNDKARYNAILNPSTNE